MTRRAHVPTQPLPITSPPVARVSRLFLTLDATQREHLRICSGCEHCKGWEIRKEAAQP